MIMLSGFTPTDACHILGVQNTWDTGTSVTAGKSILPFARRRGIPADSPEDLSRAVRRAVINRSTQVLISAAASGEYGYDPEENPGVSRMFGFPGIPHTAFTDLPGGSNEAGSLITVTSSLNIPIIALGAPVASYYPECADILSTELAVPEHAGVANAIGAVAGNVLQHAAVQIVNMEDGDFFRLHHEKGIDDFESLEEAAAAGTAMALESARKKAADAGALDIHTEVDRRDNTAQGHGREIHVSTDITATAAGRPGVS
jgi:N-methylhydantoinase A/oxoprolinase/acetone carboxylase beta subunit